MKFKNEIIKPIGPDRNGRIFSKEALEKAVINVPDKLFGELGFSDSIEIVNASHAISNIRVTDDGLVGDIEILPTPIGKMLTTIIEDQGKIGIFGLRCFGNVDWETNDVTDIRIVSVDYSQSGSKDD